MAADRHLVACQLKINGLDEFKPFKDYLSELRDKHLVSLVSLKDIDLVRQYQGRVQQLNEILEGLEQAPALARKITGD